VLLGYLPVRPELAVLSSIGLSSSSAIALFAGSSNSSGVTGVTLDPAWLLGNEHPVQLVLVGADFIMGRLHVPLSDPASWLWGSVGDRCGLDSFTAMYEFQQLWSQMGETRSSSR
jgi:hypothetical protein